MSLPPRFFRLEANSNPSFPMSLITTFKIAIPDDKIKRLKQKLALTDFPDEVVNVDDP